MGRWIAAGCVLILSLVAVYVLASRGEQSPAVGSPATSLQLSRTLGHDALRHGGSVDCVAYSPDGKLLATAGDGRVVVWDAATGKEVAALPAPRRAVTQSLLWLDNGRLVAAGNEGILLMNATEDRIQRHWESEGGDVVCLAATGTIDGLRVAAVRDQKLVVSSLNVEKDSFEKLWSVDLGKSYVTNVVLSSDGSRVFLASFEWVRCYESGNTGLVWEKEYFDGYLPRNPLACSADGRTIAMRGPMASAVLLDATNGSALRSIEQLGGDSLTALAFSAEGGILACGSNAGSASLWALGEESPPRYLPPIRGYIVCSIAFAPDLQTVAVGDGCGVRLWDRTSGLEVGFDEGHQSGLAVLAVSPDGSRLASGDVNGAICIWDLTDGNWLRRIDVNDRGVEVLSYSPDGQRVAAGSSTGMLRIWDPSTGRQMMHWEDIDSFSANIACWAANGSKILITDSNLMLRDGFEVSTSGVYVLDSFSGDREALPGLEHEVLDIASTPQGDLISVATADGLRLYSGATLTELRRIETSRTIYRMRLAADGSLMAGWGWGSEGSSDVVVLWDTASGKTVAEVQLGSEAHVSDAALSPDGKLLACCLGGALRMWTTSPIKEVAGMSVEELPAAQTTLTFTPDGQRLITGGDDSRILVWSLSH